MWGIETAPYRSLIASQRIWEVLPVMARWTEGERWRVRLPLAISSFLFHKATSAAVTGGGPRPTTGTGIVPATYPQSPCDIKKAVIALDQVLQLEPSKTGTSEVS